MARWQKRARLGLGLFGIACAIAVYAAIGDRQASSPVERPARLDPRAILEIAGAAFQQFRETKQEFVIEAERQLTYEDDTTKFIGITIKVRNRGGRDFTVSGREGQVGENEEELEIVGNVKLMASDGFTLNADRATFSKSDSTVRVPGAVTFFKGGMSGSGKRMTYNQTGDVLSLAEDARVASADESGRIQTEFSSTSATLARRDKYLALDGNVHALRGEQILEAQRGVARLSADEERITFIELRGDARVAGGGEFDSMTARDIDLDYTEDGVTLEQVALRGNGAVAMKGEREGVSGRQFLGESLDLVFASDSSLIGAVGRDGIRVNLPAAADTPARNIKARGFNASGEPGKGLTLAQFDDDVEYAEEGRADRPPRTARSTSLRAALTDEAITSAVFSGRANFQEGDLQASGAQADYDPVNGTLRLSGGDSGSPRVSNPDIQVEAESITVTLGDLRMLASGAVKTVLRQQRTAPSRTTAAATAGAASDGRLPSLLEPGNPVNVNANGLDYQDAAGKAVYSGAAALWQGETAIRGDRLTLDRTRGDFIASGAARSNIVLDTGVSVGRASEIRYDDAARRITYIGEAPLPGRGAPPTAAATASASTGRGVPAAAPPASPASAARGGSPVAPASPQAAGRGVTPAAPAAPPQQAAAGRGVAPVGPPAAPAPVPAQVSGPQGDLRARRVEVVLAASESRLERLEAYTEVNARLDSRVATGDRLTYHAADERYVMTGIATVPVRIVEVCREARGRTITFFKSADRIIVDGNEEVRTQSSRSGPCPQPAAR
jgi:lipopolysaccharide export system protein LptA